jgi:hypothetical protein
MGFLYIDSQGEEKTRHSYSAGLEFDTCPYRFHLKRILGWRERDNKGALLFGRALESAIQFYHDNNGVGGVEEFQRLWIAHKTNEKLTYTAKEISWENLMRAGTDMMKLYAIRQPSLPIPLNTRFQREFLKEIFPGDERLGGIEFYGKLDAMPLVDPHHPMLLKIDWKESYGLFRPLIVDIKTSGIDLDDTFGIVAHDLQLRTYAWLTGIFDVAFLWFKKAGVELSKGISVTLLEDASDRFKAGDEAVVAQVNKDENFTVILLKDDTEMEEMRKAQGFKENGNLDTTKAAVQRKDEWLAQHGVVIPQYKVTRQRLQFSSGRVDRRSAEDAGQIAADQIARIVNAWESNKWPNTFGIRYPHDDRRDPFFRAFVLKDSVFRDGMFEQKNDEFFDDEAESEEAQ